MNPDNIIKAIQAVFQGALVRAIDSNDGWLIEVVHAQYGVLGALKFRKEFEKILAKVPNSSPPVKVWKLFGYSEEKHRYLGRGTLHAFHSTSSSGMRPVTVDRHYAYLDIPEFDAELLVLANWRGHSIPALETVDASGRAILPYRDGQYDWLDILGDEYTVQQTARAGLLDGRQRINVQL